MNQLRRIREALWNPNANPLVFFIAAFFLGISVNLTSSLLEAALTEKKAYTAFTAIAFGIPGLLVFAILAPRVFRWWTGEELETSAKLRHPRPHKVLIAIASLGSGIDTAEKAIKYHLPALEKVWLLCSKGESEPLARELKRKLETELRFQSDVIEPVPLTPADFEHPEAVKDAIENIYGNLQEHLSESDVIIDITGGRKTTTAGAFLAGLPRGRHLEVINPKEIDAAGRGTKPDDPVQIDIDFWVKKARTR
jgi:hypothetical protein